jgi:hypothetical protein
MKISTDDVAAALKKGYFKSNVYRVIAGDQKKAAAQ